MTQAAIVDLNGLRVAVAGQRIPRQAVITMREASSLTEAAAQMLTRAQEQAEALRIQARAEGYRAGCDSAVADAAKLLLDARISAQAQVESSEQRIVHLALAIVARIAPRLAENGVVPALIEEALRCFRAERYVVIHVHPSAHAAVAAELDRWRALQPMAQSLQIVVDESQDALGVVIESESGQLQAGLTQQLAVIREHLHHITTPLAGDASVETPGS